PTAPRQRQPVTRSSYSDGAALCRPRHERKLKGRRTRSIRQSSGEIGVSCCDKWVITHPLRRAVVLRGWVQCPRPPACVDSRERTIALRSQKESNHEEHHQTA